MAEMDMSPVIVAAAEYLLDDGIHDHRKVKFFVELLRPATTAHRSLECILLKCRNCAEEDWYTLKSPLGRGYKDRMCQRLQATTLGSIELYAAMMALGIICPSCYAKSDECIRRWRDGYPLKPPAIRTIGDLVEGIMTVLEIYVDDPSLLDILRPYKRNYLPINKSLLRGAPEADNDMLQAMLKFVKFESDEQMRQSDHYCRDPAKNRELVAHCDRIWVLVTYAPDGSTHVMEPTHHDYESARAANMSVKMKPCDIYDREKSCCWGLINHTFKGKPIPNKSVPPWETYHIIPTRGTESVEATTADRKVLVESPDAKDGYIEAQPVKIPYHHPMSRFDGRGIPERREYVMDYVEALNLFRHVKARHRDEDRAVQEMLDGADNEAARDLAAAIHVSLGLNTPPALQVSATTQDAVGLTSTLPRDKQHTTSSALSRSPRFESNDRPPHFVPSDKEQHVQNNRNDSRSAS